MIAKKNLFGFLLFNIGKTTCCLYRMWTKFFKYWQRASEIGEPWLPRDIAFVHQDKTQEDAGKTCFGLCHKCLVNTEDKTCGRYLRFIFYSCLFLTHFSAKVYMYRLICVFQKWQYRTYTIYFMF